MRMWEISPRANSPKNDDPPLWKPLHAEPAHRRQPMRLNSCASSQLDKSPRHHISSKAMKIGILTMLCAAILSVSVRAQGDMSSLANASNSQIVAAARADANALRGSEDFWAAEFIHAIGTANFVFDKSQTPNCNACDIYSFFGVACSTGQSK